MHSCVGAAVEDTNKVDKVARAKTRSKQVVFMASGRMEEGFTKVLAFPQAEEVEEQCAGGRTAEAAAFAVK